MVWVPHFRHTVSCVHWLGLSLFGVFACGNVGNVDTAPTKLGGATAVSTGLMMSCAVRRDGTVLCWGFSSGAYSDPGSTLNSPLAIDVYGITGATAVSVGRGFCALLADGTVRCRGATDPPGITSVAALSSGYSHDCALLEVGTIQCWGANDYGQLGVGTAAESDVLPSTVLGITDAAGVSAGYNETCAALADGTVRCWGVNSYGQLGDGTTTDSSVPVTVLGLTDAVAACTGDGHSCARLRDGSVQCWGANSFGQLGNGTTTDSTVPVVVAGITNATTITCGDSHTCVLLNDGSIQCWGADGGGGGGIEVIGALGNPTVTGDCKWDLTPHIPNFPYPSMSVETTCTPIPVQVSGINNAVTVAAGYYTTCAVLTDGSVQCWGDNLDGQLGNGSTSNSILPVTVMAKFGQ
jgi:Regulator of chromosome condensation (RCC1) repeat